MATNIKTQFTFSSRGFNIYSKKGSLFIQKENIKNIHIEFEEKTYKNSTGTSTSRYYTIFAFVLDLPHLCHAFVPPVKDISRQTFYL